MSRVNGVMIYSDILTLRPFNRGLGALFPERAHLGPVDTLAHILW